MTRRPTGGFQSQLPAGAQPICPVIPPEGVPIRTAATGKANPLRSLGATFARQALAKHRTQAEAWLTKNRRDDDLEIRPGVYRRADAEHRRPDYWVCMDCRQPDPMFFMVEDDVWTAAGLDKGVICPTCLEKRLGRKLVIQDFQHVPGNDAIFFGYLMGIIQ